MAITNKDPEAKVTIPYSRYKQLSDLEDAIKDSFKHTIETHRYGNTIYTNDEAVRFSTSLLVKLQKQIDLFKKSFDQKIKKIKLFGYTIIKTSDLDNLPVI